MCHFRRLLAALGCAFVSFHVGPANAEKRVALVIGNSAYQLTRPLPNPRNDADAIAKMLRSIGFADVTLKLDLDYRAMRDAVRAFEEAAREADIALMYYGGHGLEIAGENYLVPTDAKLARDSDLEYEAVTLASVLNAVRGARRLRVVILDACRNNPLGEKISLSAGATRSVARGLARIEPKGEVLVAYSARAGTLAQDGPGRHSPYAEALLKHIGTPGLDVLRMFGRVKEAVLKATKDAQEPWIYGSPSGDVVALVPGSWSAEADAAHRAAAAEAARKAAEAERARAAEELRKVREERRKVEEERRSLEAERKKLANAAPPRPPRQPETSPVAVESLPDPNHFYRLSTRYGGRTKALGASSQDAYLSVAGRQWKFVPAGDDTYRLTTSVRGTTMCLDVWANNLQAHLERCANVTGQFWRISVDGDWVRLSTVYKGPSFCLDVYANTFQAHLERCANVTGQFWLLTRTD